MDNTTKKNPQGRSGSGGSQPAPKGKVAALRGKKGRVRVVALRGCDGRLLAVTFEVR